MTDLRAAAQQALSLIAAARLCEVNSMSSRQEMLRLMIEATDTLRAALAEPETPPEAQTQAEKVAYCAGWWDALAKARKAALVEPVQEPYTGDVTRIIREAGMTFHLGLPHKPVIEQMSRVVDLVYAEASIKAAQQFAAPPQRLPLTDEEIREIFFAELRALPSYPSAVEELPERLARAFEAAHGIGSKT